MRDLRRRWLPCCCLAAASCGALVVAHSNIIGGGSNAGTTTETIVVTCDDGFSGSATSTCTAVPGQTTSAWSTVTCAGVAAACARLCLCGPARAHVCHDVAARAILRPPPRRRTVLLCLSTLQVSSPEPTSLWRPRLPPQRAALAVSAPAAWSANHARRAPSPMSRKGRALRPAASAALSTRRPTPPTAAT